MRKFEHTRLVIIEGIILVQAWTIGMALIGVVINLIN